MRLRSHIMLFIGIIGMYHHLLMAEHQAFINTPVADALIKNIPFPQTAYSWHTSAHTISRCLQLLLHEPVTVLSQGETVALVRVPDGYYSKNGNTYFIAKKNLTPLKPEDEHYLPFTTDLDSIKTLISPFSNPTTGLTFSAGTRFVVSLKDSTAHSFAVFFYNKDTQSFELQTISRSLFFTSSGNKRQDFVTIVKAWTQTKEGFAPYLWGGSSFLYRLNQPFSLEKNGSQYFWMYPDDNHSIKSGFDCSGLVWRAARTASIILPGRNTTMLSHLKSVTKNDILEQGDLLIFPHHACIVSDIDKNLLIEALGFDAKRGKVHEIPLADNFENVATYNDLKKIYLAKQPLISRQTKRALPFTIVKLPL